MHYSLMRQTKACELTPGPTALWDPGLMNSDPRAKFSAAILNIIIWKSTWVNQLTDSSNSFKKDKFLFVQASSFLAAILCCLQIDAFLVLTKRSITTLNATFLQYQLEGQNASITSSANNSRVIIALHIVQLRWHKYMGRITKPFWNRKKDFNSFLKCGIQML